MYNIKLCGSLVSYDFDQGFIPYTGKNDIFTFKPAVLEFKLFLACLISHYTYLLGKVYASY